jgi:hypothetical protein
MSASGIIIPYERQSESQTDRLCGAAAMSMVFGSFGKRVPQAEIWPRIARKSPSGGLTSATYLMAQEALSHGYSALAIQARQPLQALRICRDAGIRAILNHRAKENSPSGHYTVLVDIDQDGVVVHDPADGPSRRMTHRTLLELWRPLFPNPEITGNVLIGIADRTEPASPCSVCGIAIPSEIRCGACDKPILLQPSALLGCVGLSCAARTWTYLCCPHCDYTWSFALRPTEDSSKLLSATSLPDFSAVLGELDKFCDAIGGMPALAGRPDVQQHLTYLRGTRERVKLAQAEQLAHQRTTLARMAQLENRAKQDEEAIQKRKAEAEKPGTSPDGNALGQDLLKSLGFLSSEPPGR